MKTNLGDFISQFNYVNGHVDEKFENAKEEAQLESKAVIVAQMKGVEQTLEKVLKFFFESTTSKAQTTYHVNDM
jgi:hypothetical protein